MQEEQTNGTSPKNKVNKTLAVIIAILLLIIAIIAVIFIIGKFFIEKGESGGEAKTQAGERITVDDFYHATDGLWEMETTIHILKSQKFVSSDIELKSYLVKTVNPGETVRIARAGGRWKYLELIRNGEVIAEGWADAEDGRAKKQETAKTVK